MRFLRATYRVNTLYPAVWNRGTTLHPSTVMKSAGSPSRNRLTSLPCLPFQQSLKSLVHHAHRPHLRIIPWFEYGLWVPSNAAIAQKHPNWLTTTIESHQGVHPPSNPNDKEWVAWQADQITQLMTKIVTKGHAAKLNLIISLSPSSPQFAYNKYLNDWITFSKRGPMLKSK